MDCNTPGFHVLHHLPEFTQTNVHWVDDAIQPSHPLSPPSPLALNLCSEVLTFPLFSEKRYHQLHLSRMVRNFEQLILLDLLNYPILLTLLSSSLLFLQHPYFLPLRASFSSQPHHLPLLVIFRLFSTKPLVLGLSAGNRTKPEQVREACFFRATKKGKTLHHSGWASSQGA